MNFFKIRVFTLACFTGVSSFAQSDTLDSNANADTSATDKKWLFNTENNFIFSQTSFSNWAAGGKNLIDFKGETKGSLTYSNNKFNWNNDFHLAYGGQFTDEEDAKNVYSKSDDRIFLNSLVYREYTPNWSFSGIVNFETQFSNGFENKDTKNIISSFMAPGYLNMGLGTTYKKENSLLVISPISGKITFVNNQDLANQGAFGVEEAVIDTATGAIIIPGKNMKNEMGLFIRISKKGEINNIVNYSTDLKVFSYYSTLFKSDFRWDLRLKSKVNKYISVIYDITLLYDDNTFLFKENGDKENPKIQFKQYIGLAFSYNFP